MYREQKIMIGKDFLLSGTGDFLWSRLSPYSTSCVIWLTLFFGACTQQITYISGFLRWWLIWC